MEAVKKEKRESKKCVLHMTTNCSITSQHIHMYQSTARVQAVSTLH